MSSAIFLIVAAIGTRISASLAVSSQLVGNTRNMGDMLVSNVALKVNALSIAARKRDNCVSVCELFFTACPDSITPPKFIFQHSYCPGFIGNLSATPPV